MKQVEAEPAVEKEQRIEDITIGGFGVGSTLVRQSAGTVAHERHGDIWSDCGGPGIALPLMFDS